MPNNVYTHSDIKSYHSGVVEIRDPPATVFEDNGEGFTDFVSTRETMRLKVVKILRKNEQARNDDNLLIVTYLAEELHIDKINCLSDDYKKLPNGIFGTLIRTRALIQNEEHKLLPTDPEVRKHRGITETYWREWLPIAERWTG